MPAPKVLVTGGAGYVGSALVPRLIQAGRRVTVYDLMWYGEGGLVPGPNLTLVRADIRDTPRLAQEVRGADAVIHLACVSNDPSFELDPALGRSINYDCFEPMIQACREAGVRRFIYASSSSVYGVSDAPEVAEDHPLRPLTDYSRYKALCEEVLRRYESPDFRAVIVRPATVCGWAPRMRLDLSVNLLTSLAVNKRRITVFGGSQKRPNLHIDDMAELYLRLLDLPEERIAGKTFNAGRDNRSIADLAQAARRVVEEEMPEKAPVEIVTSPTDDLRSYHISSAKIARELGFTPRRTVEDAVRDVCRAFKAGRLSPDDEDRCYNVRVMKSLFDSGRPS